LPVYDAGRVADGRPYFTMPIVEGETLARVLANRREPGDEIERLLVAFEKICIAIGHAHERDIVHRDLKPGNIMLGRSDAVIVMDWGVAMNRQLAATSPWDGGVWVFGTPAYMPPEQASGRLVADPRADVFGLGAILCEILTGGPPYIGTDAPTVMRLAAAGDLADARARLRRCDRFPEFADLACQCLAPRADDRPANAGEVVESLRELAISTDSVESLRSF
jgi:serine/threonine protein kinase